MCLIDITKIGDLDGSDFLNSWICSKDMELICEAP